MRISDWSSDVCSSDLHLNHIRAKLPGMGTVINFEDRAVAHLQARVAAAEEATQDLIAFARRHSGAVAPIHAAVLAAVAWEGLDQLIPPVTQEWPQFVRPTPIAVASFVSATGIGPDAKGTQNI